VIDLNALRERTGHDEELVREVMRDFLAVSEQMVGEVARSVEAGDFPDVSRHSHRLRGALTVLGATTAASAAGQLESASGRTTPPPDAHAWLTSMVAALREQVDEACAQMRAYCEGGAESREM
jgi:HPt (histidine-containing phosphotransfer) domain-containing protein